jgi:putative NADPH-quinone reductase
MLKGWFDRVWASGVAWDLPEGANRLAPRLRNVRKVVAVTTHGSPKKINMVEGEGGKRTITRSPVCAPCVIRSVALRGSRSTTLIGAPNRSV